MSWTGKLAGLLALLIVGGFVIIFVSTNIISTAGLTPAQSVPLYAGIVGFLATIITLLHGEISARYTEKRAQAQKRWELVFPILQDSYVPWINSAKKLLGVLKKDINFSEHELNRILYFICLFYGIRLRFVITQGGLILLGTKIDENNVNAAYDNIKNSFQWAGDRTATQVSELQDYFLRNNKLDDPLVFKNFEDELNGKRPLPLPPSDPKTPTKPQPKYDFKKSRDKLKDWLESDPKNSAGVRKALENFVNVFEQAISDFSGREN